MLIIESGVIACRQTCGNLLLGKSYEGNSSKARAVILRPAPTSCKHVAIGQPESHIRQSIISLSALLKLRLNSNINVVGILLLLIVQHPAHVLKHVSGGVGEWGELLLETQHSVHGQGTISHPVIVVAAAPGNVLVGTSNNTCISWSEAPY